MFGNPVAQAVIRPHGSPLVVGDFRVTATFGQLDADHLTPHMGVDIGDGQCGEPLLAMASGTITLAGYLGPALVVRGISAANPDYEWAIAHCAGLTVSMGQIVQRGQRIGTLGKTGTTACHAHLGCKHKGVEVDIWPLLDQNQEALMPGFKATGPVIGTFLMPAGQHALISPLDTKQRYPQPAGGTFSVFASLNLLTDIDGHTPPQNGREQVYLVDAPNFGAGAYALRSDGTFTATSDPLNAKITALIKERDDLTAKLKAIDLVQHP